MTQSDSTNRKFVLAKRSKGEPDDSTLRLETEDIPTPGKGQMLLRNAYLSLAPYMRGRMSDAPSYGAPVAIGVLPAAFVLILQQTILMGLTLTATRRRRGGTLLQELCCEYSQPLSLCLKPGCVDFATAS